MKVPSLKAIIFGACCSLWLAAYGGLLFARLNVYEDFYKSGYSYFYHLLGIVETATLYAVLAVCVFKSWTPSAPRKRYFFIINVVMVIFAAVPPISPFEFFLFRQKNEGDPFASCKTDCALAYDPDSVQLGINDTLDVFIIYSPLDRFGECVGSHKGQKCALLVSDLGIDKRYGITEFCEYTVVRLSKANYYSLTSHNCR